MNIYDLIMQKNYSRGGNNMPGMGNNHNNINLNGSMGGRYINSTANSYAKELSSSSGSRKMSMPQRSGHNNNPLSNSVNINKSNMSNNPLGMSGRSNQYDNQNTNNANTSARKELYCVCERCRHANYYWKMKCENCQESINSDGVIGEPSGLNKGNYNSNSSNNGGNVSSKNHLKTSINSNANVNVNENGSNYNRSNLNNPSSHLNVSEKNIPEWICSYCESRNKGVMSYCIKCYKTKRPKGNTTGFSGSALPRGNLSSNNGVHSNGNPNGNQNNNSNRNSNNNGSSFNTNSNNRSNVNGGGNGITDKNSNYNSYFVKNQKPVLLKDNSNINRVNTNAYKPSNTEDIIRRTTLSNKTSGDSLRNSINVTNERSGMTRNINPNASINLSNYGKSGINNSNNSNNSMNSMGVMKRSTSNFNRTRYNK